MLAYEFIYTTVMVITDGWLAIIFRCDVVIQRLVMCISVSRIQGNIILINLIGGPPYPIALNVIFNIK